METMKFSEITREQWEELSPYLDTCLLPVTGMPNTAKPYEATEWLEQLRDIMDLIEIPFKGRVVTYPAWHYISDSERLSEHLNEWCASAKRGGFRYVIVVTANKQLIVECPEVDLWFGPSNEGELPLQSDVSNAIRSLWSGQAT
jgi:23S rRNA (pseudouridine1915-N3)-methyltransferase